MPDPSGRSENATGRRRTQMILRGVIFAGVIAFFMLRPQLEEWFGDPNPGTDEQVTTQERGLGELTETRRDVFESTAGLVYSEYRIDHVLEHTEDDLSKPIHGVFSGDRAQTLAVIDEAFLAAKEGAQTVTADTQGDRLVYVVDMQREIGHVGGQQGERRNNPVCRNLKLVLENDNEVVTAYPTVK